ncbi:glycosyltransferase involved in cell wall biosynthesis [Cellulophaga sp. RHA_52]|uniref:glycosyltransferase n=1 Tax=Cellulophaga sp. RHA_52 TaxID=1250036 RepID=UPI00119C70CF|nr:glycosyltransferase [Cellulophaga sp. RHA_52]TVZ08245.1 glycosyltransferase involved in cell wall biosynthesis [Cellulophaga sp. RHA_52]
MKIAYILPIDIEKYEGVLNKVDSQVLEWINNKNEVVIYLITNNNISHLESTSLYGLYKKGKIEIIKLKQYGGLPVDLIKDWLNLDSAYRSVLNKLVTFKPDVIYARTSLYQPFYKKLGKNNNLIIEANTDTNSEYNLQKFQTIKYFLRYIYFKLTNYFFLKRVTAIAAVTNEIAALFKKKNTRVFPNSIIVDNYPKFSSKNNKKKKVVFLGSPNMPWQGIDILLLLSKKMINIDFDVIGYEGKDFEMLPNVNFHGFMNKKKYLEILEYADASIGTMALYRKNMQEACPLKVREYLACCKPVILPYKDTAFELNGYPEWVLKLPNSREGILNSVEEITSFINKCDQLVINKNDVKKYVDVSEIEKNRLQFFKEIMDKK